MNRSFIGEKAIRQGQLNFLGQSFHGYVSRSRLISAREFRGMSRKLLAEQVGVSPAAITLYESGQNQPSAEVIEKIAQKLMFPTSWFFQDDIFMVKDNALTYRAHSRMTAATRWQARQYWNFAAIITEYFRINYRLPPTSLPDLSGEKPEVAAQSLRDTWGLGNSPISNMVHLLESKGIMLFWTDIHSRSVDAYCNWLDECPIIVLNSNERAGERLRFNAAHELAHLVLHHAEISKQGEDDEEISDENSVNEKIEAQSRREKEAHQFAAAFLMPRTSWREESPLQPNLSAFLDLKARWGVSAQAMLRRSRDLLLLSEWQYESAVTKLSARGWRLSEPDALTIEESLMHRKVLELMKRNGQSSEDFARHLHLSYKDLEMLMPLASEFRKSLWNSASPEIIKRKSLPPVIKFPNDHKADE